MLITIRSIASFIILLFFTRIMGKRQISHLTFFDYCVGITIGSIAAEMSVDQNVKIINGIVSLTIWGILPIIIAYLGIKSDKFRNFTDGRPAIIIKNGQIMEKSMKKNLLTIDELMLLLREKDIFKVSDVEMAVLETNGQLSVMKKSSQQTVTPQMLKMVLKQENAPTLLIMDGQILHKNLRTIGITKEWLLKEIQKQGATTIEDIFLAQIDSNNQLYVDLYDDSTSTK